MSPRALLVAGEASGDFYGAILVRELRDRFPDRQFVAYGGQKMADAGAVLAYNLVDEAVFGISEALVRLPRFYRIWRGLDQVLRTERPSPVILIDYPGFNIRVAKRARELGLETIYFIPPKVWVWHASRAETLARVSSLIVTIFPFEPPLYECHGGRAVYCGHPLVDLVTRTEPRDTTNETTTTVTILPGSRPQELARLFPRFLEAAALVHRQRPDVRFVVPRAHTLEAGMLERYVDEAKGQVPVEVVDEEAAAVLSRSRAALAASGTVTLEAAIVGIPMVIAYAVSPLSAAVFRIFVRAPYVGLPNIVAGREVCPEYLQGDATPEALSRTLLPLLDETPERAAQLDGLGEVRQRLGSQGSMRRIVEAMGPFFATPSPDVTKLPRGDTR